MPEIGTYSLSGGRRLARKRASSDPTDTLNHCWLAALTNSMASSPVAEKLMRIKRQNCPSEADGKWAGSRETNLDSGRGRTFFLTSLFIELIDMFGVSPSDGPTTFVMGV